MVKQVGTRRFEETGAQARSGTTGVAVLCSIDEVLDTFLAEQRERLAERTMNNYEYVIELLKDCLNGYGEQSLSEAERKRWKAAYDGGDEEAFCHVFGANKIVENYGEFLDYFMVRKVMAGEELLRASGTVTKKLAKWLAVHGLLDEGSLENAVEHSASASRDLPRAEKLAGLLFEASRSASRIDPDAIAEGDWIEDFLIIDKVNGDDLFFGGGIGPVHVSGAGKLAKPGWMVTITLALHNGRWQVVEVGNVYP